MRLIYAYKSALIIESPSHYVVAVVKLAMTFTYPKCVGPAIARPCGDVHLGDEVIAITLTRRPYLYSGTPTAYPVRESRTAMRSGTVART